jgi:hypothetical protein
MTFRIADSPTVLRIHALTCTFPARSALASTGTCVVRGHYGYYVTYNDRLRSLECLPSEGVFGEFSGLNFLDYVRRMTFAIEIRAER